MSTPFEEKRLGRVLLSEAFVTGTRSRDVFAKFSVLLAVPRSKEPGIICYYGAHPDFEPYEGDPKNSPYYNIALFAIDEGFYFKRADEPVTEEGFEVKHQGFLKWMEELDKLFFRDFGMGSDDHEDYNWFDEFDNDVEPDEAYSEWYIHTEGGTRSPGL